MSGHRAGPRARPTIASAALRLAQGPHDSDPPVDGSPARDSWYDTETRARRRRVVIIDADTDTREANVWCLRAAGWRVEEASSGAEGHFLAVTFAPDALVVDVSPSEPECIELIRQLRGGDAMRDAVIVACAGGDRREGIELEVLATGAGADAFLVKPFRPEDLRDVLQEVARRRGRRSAV